MIRPDTQAAAFFKSHKKQAEALAKVSRRAARQKGQSRMGSLAESLVSVAVGFCVSMVFQVFITRHYGLAASLLVNFKITVWFTALSILRGYLVRRWFNRRT